MRPVRFNQRLGYLGGSQLKKAMKAGRGSPKSQNERQTLGSAPLKMVAILDLYMAQEAAGEPGNGSIPLL